MWHLRRVLARRVERGGTTHSARRPIAKMGASIREGGTRSQEGCGDLVVRPISRATGRRVAKRLGDGGRLGAQHVGPELLLELFWRARRRVRLGGRSLARRGIKRVKTRAPSALLVFAVSSTRGGLSGHFLELWQEFVWVAVCDVGGSERLVLVEERVGRRRLGRCKQENAGDDGGRRKRCLGQFVRIYNLDFRFSHSHASTAPSDTSRQSSHAIRQHSRLQLASHIFHVAERTGVL